jgi:3-phenylpropionate/cinnamic acid dioxygenase small subunit
VNEAIQTLLEQSSIQDVLHGYARACDSRLWSAFDDIFCLDVVVNYGGEFRLEGRAAVIDMIQSMLGGCGPTQHLLGNIDITVAGDRAHSRCYVRAVHAGLGEAENLYYEVWAEYHDELTRLPAGWRIRQRKMLVHKEVGSRAVLKPMPSPPGS